jgi:hypothetical protein
MDILDILDIFEILSQFNTEEDEILFAQEYGLLAISGTCCGKTMRIKAILFLKTKELTSDEMFSILAKKFKSKSSLFARSYLPIYEILRLCFYFSKIELILIELKKNKHFKRQDISILI